MGRGEGRELRRCWGLCPAAQAGRARRERGKGDCGGWVGRTSICFGV